MKYFIFVLIVFLVVLPLSADVIVSGGVNSSSPSGSGWIQITLPICGLGIYHSSMANASVVLNTNGSSGSYAGNADVSRTCPVEMHGGTPGVSFIYWETMPVGGDIPVPLTISPGGGWVDGNWTTTGSVFGYYTWWNGQGISDEDFIDYDFTGPAEFDFTVWGLLENPHIQMTVSFSANAPSPIPEPSTFLLLGTGLTGICCHKLRW